LGSSWVVEGLETGEKVVVTAAGRVGDLADRLCWQVMSHKDIMFECC
jgi:hypothetical protein